MPARKPNYWLFKSEPDVFSYDDLVAAPGKKTLWDGVRNYQARNFMRDDMKKGDRLLYYHSRTTPPGVAGVAEIVRDGYPDPTQFDAKDSHYDAKSNPDDPRWYCVDIRAKAKAKTYVTISDLKANAALKDMAVTQKGQRLSVQPVTEAEWFEVCSMLGLKS
ncbi:MAG: putative RNA-binding protein with PUA-like domain [Planctomycetota bacterium]|jgi:predicted RNA-binding protein with PUA-like domain